MKVLMLSWELPPAIVGGVGMVCAEICRELSKYKDIEIEYAMPYGPMQYLPFSSNCNVIGVQHEEISSKSLKISKIPTLLSCYQTPDEYLDKYSNLFKNIKEGMYKTPKQLYGENILQEVELYAHRILQKYKNHNFDVIHAHDWTTMKAAILLKQLTGVKIIYHVHITEYDKTGNSGGHQEIINLEKYGFDNADSIVAVSNYVKSQLVNKYQVNPNKIQVVYNAMISDLVKSLTKTKILRDKKSVLFMGRMTLQKGPEYFLKAAKKVLDYKKDVNFIVAGGGDMLNQMIELACELEISDNVYFHGGAYSRIEADKYYSSGDVFVMPSVSEPFGVVPYEAIVKGTPVVISKQSGISEVLQNALKVDFWDTDEMAHQILALLEYPAMHQCLQENGYKEIDSHTWEKPVQQLIELYGKFKR